MEKGKIRRLINIPEELKADQEYFIEEAENNTTFYMESYRNHPSSLNGHYVCSDLFKETFQKYTESLESRKRYSEVIHNSAAVLANEMFHQNVQDPSIKECIFLSGVPGGGKSFLIQSLALSGAIGDDTMIYEGDITTPTIIEKIEAAKKAGKTLHIIVVNPTLELAQRNAINRSFEIGRGASCETMARILSRIPGALENIHASYPEIDLAIYNKTTNYDITCEYGFEKATVLNHGSYEEILEKLRELRVQLLSELKKKIEDKKIKGADENEKHMQ